MDQKPEVIRQQMEATRASLTDKLEALENKVVGTVHGATTAVSDTVASVKDAVQETVQTVKGSVRETVASVKDTVDITHHVETHPWLMFGASVAAGFLGGKLLLGPAPARRSAYEARHPGDWGRGPARRGEALGAAADFDGAHEGNGHHEQYTGPRAEARAKEERVQGLVSQITERFGPEIEKLKGVAVGTLLGFVREMLTRSVPEQLGAQLSSVVDDVTRKLGGQPVRGPLLKDNCPEPGSGRPAASYST
jgi:ElaB/YqjD/DUF883 family membrane-anchored ribosome-binding protein